jgi:hypothetical protein
LKPSSTFPSGFRDLPQTEHFTSLALAIIVVLSRCCQLSLPNPNHKEPVNKLESDLVEVDFAV